MIRFILSFAVLLLSCFVYGGELPEPTFQIDFDGSAVPTKSSGQKKHPSLKTDNLQFVDGRQGKALLLGKCDPLFYQAGGSGGESGGGNIPDVATIRFWVKPLDWQKIEKWRYLVSINPEGRSMMFLAHYPKKKPVLQFLWTGGTTD